MANPAGADIGVETITISKGVAKFTPTSGSEVDLGEVSQFSYTQDVTRKDFFTNRSGIRSKLKSVVTQLSATIKMTLHSINDFNLALAVLGETGTDSIDGLTDTQKTGTLTFTGANDVGTQLTFSGKVQLQPGGDINVLQDSDDWMALPINAEVLLDSGAYGTWTASPGNTA